MKIQTMVAAIGLLALPAVAGAQAGVRVEAAAEARASTGATEGAAGGDAALRATAEAGLPDAPVRRVIAEGRAKGAGEAEIGRVAMEEHHRLRLAGEALRGKGGEASDAAIVAGAEALATGSTAAELRLLRNAAPDDRALTASLSALAELQGRGVAPASAASELAGRLRAGGLDAGVGGAAAAAAAGRAVGGAAAVTGSLGASLGL